MGHDHVYSYDTSAGWFQGADLKVIHISCKNLFRNRALINIFKPIIAVLLIFVNNWLQRVKLVTVQNI
jgi:hypothetical protein